MDFSAVYPLERYPFIGGLIWRKHAVFHGAVANTSGWKDSVMVLDMKIRGSPVSGNSNVWFHCGESVL